MSEGLIPGNNMFVIGRARSTIYENMSRIIGYCYLVYCIIVDHLQYKRIAMCVVLLNEKKAKNA